MDDGGGEGGAGGVGDPVSGEHEGMPGSLPATAVLTWKSSDEPLLRPRAAVDEVLDAVPDLIAVHVRAGVLAQNLDAFTFPDLANPRVRPHRGWSCTRR